MSTAELVPSNSKSFNERKKSEYVQSKFRHIHIINDYISVIVNLRSLENNRPECLGKDQPELLGKLKN